MTYIVITRGKNIDQSIKIEAGIPLHIKVSSRDAENQPILGFVSIDLGEEYLKRKNIPQDEYEFILIEKGVREEFKKQPILLIENESQADEMEKDTEGYDYEKHIYENAL